MTLLTAPAEIFAQALPLKINRIMQSTAEGRRTTEWHQRLTGMTLQGRWVIEDTTTGQRMERSQQEINALFEQFPGRYRVVLSGQLK